MLTCQTATNSYSHKGSRNCVMMMAAFPHVHQDSFNTMSSNSRRAAMWSVPTHFKSANDFAPRLSFQTDLVMIRTSPSYSPFITKLTTAITSKPTQQLIASYFYIIFVNILGLIFAGMNEADYRSSTPYFSALGTPV